MLVGDDTEQHLAETLHCARPNLAVGVGDARALRFRQLAFEFASLRCEVEKPLSPISNTRTLDDEALPHQLAENAAQALLGDALTAEQLANSHLRMASDKMDYAMMGASKIVLREYRVRLCGEVAVRKKQQLDPLPHLVLGRRGR